MTYERELNVETLKTTQRKKKKWKRHKQNKQGSTIELLTLNGLQTGQLSGQPCKKEIRRLYRRNKIAKAILRQINVVERAIFMTNNLTNNIKSALEKNELWRCKLSIRQHSNPASSFAKPRPNKRYKPGN